MWFDPCDIGDYRVEECSLSVPAYPLDIETAPENEGIYVLLDRDYHVLYIGHAEERGVRAELEANRGSQVARSVRWYLWVNARNSEEAKTLLGEWVRKYHPLNGPGVYPLSDHAAEGRSKVLPFPSQGSKRTRY